MFFHIMMCIFHICIVCVLMCVAKLNSAHALLTNTYDNSKISISLPFLTVYPVQYCRLCLITYNKHGTTFARRWEAVCHHSIGSCGVRSV